MAPTTKSVALALLFVLCGATFIACGAPQAPSAPNATSSGPAQQGGVGGQPQQGGTVTIAMYQEPSALLYYYDPAHPDFFMPMIGEGLVGVAPDGSFYPLLIQSIPTKENGGL
jgi:ABC-type transport system substrate-binding protein